MSEFCNGLNISVSVISDNKATEILEGNISQKKIKMFLKIIKFITTVLLVFIALLGVSLIFSTFFLT